MTPIAQTIVNGQLPSDPLPINLGPKEIFFLGTILFFGFCGFSVCYDTINAASETENINHITEYQVDITHLISRSTASDRGYTVSE